MKPDSTVVEYKAALSIVEVDGVHHLPYFSSFRQDTVTSQSRVGEFI